GDPVAVAAVSLFRYGPRFACLGLYIVRPARRGRGHGIAGWRAAVEPAGSRTVGLDGVDEHQARFRRSSFVLARLSVSYGWWGDAEAPDGLVALSSVDRAQVVDFDAGVFPFRREQFLDAWLWMPGTQGLAAVRDGALVGYGVARP